MGVLNYILETESQAAALVIVSRALLLVSPYRLKALPLSVLTRLLVSTINDAFKDGGFILCANDFSNSASNNQLSIRVRSAHSRFSTP